MKLLIITKLCVRAKQADFVSSLNYEITIERIHPYHKSN